MTTQPVKEKFLSRTITIGEVLGLILAVLTVLITFYTDTQVRLSALEIEVTGTKAQLQAHHEFQLRIESKLDAIKDDVNHVRVEVSAGKQFERPAK